MRLLTFATAAVLTALAVIGCGVDGTPAEFRVGCPKTMTVGDKLNIGAIASNPTDSDWKHLYMTVLQGEDDFAFGPSSEWVRDDGAGPTTFRGAGIAARDTTSTLEFPVTATRAGNMTLELSMWGGDGTEMVPSDTKVAVCQFPVVSSPTQATMNEPTNEQATGAKPAPSMSPGQEQALRSAKEYLEFSAFSRAGLIEQLSSSAGGGFSRADATYAANHVGADWREQAYRSAKGYLEMSAFSLSGLIDQLASSAGGQFTAAQAKYGATKAYNER
ncbi:MAG: Ltp family lipoprotein [Solirubrobacterales bacterium]|nr:Ltp family lipoprotein [Solirubrobacterales bacterium]